MTRALAFTFVLISALLLSACKQSSTAFGSDVRSYTGSVSSAIPSTYSGRVIDGPMEKAKVWLDINGNGLYDSTVSVTEGTGTDKVTLSIPGGEPTATTGPDGRFTMDVSSLQFDPTVARSLNPADYPLMAMVIPGQTVDHGGDGSPENRAYVLMARPGKHILSPLSTYVEATNKYCKPVNLSCDIPVLNIQKNLGVPINLESDYIKAGDPASYAYARAFGYFLGLESPDSFNQTPTSFSALQKLFTGSALRVINTVFIKQGPTLINLVNQAAQASGGYDNLDVSKIGITPVAVNIGDPQLLLSQKVYIKGASEPEATTTADLLSTSDNVSAVLHWHYTPDGQVTDISVDGYMQPSLISLAKLAGANGYVPAMESPGLLWFFDRFNPAQAGSSTLVTDGVADERMTFDWSKKKAYYYSTYTGHGATSSALGSTPQDTFSWSENTQGQVISVSDDTRTLAITYADSSPDSRVTSYIVTRNSDGATLRSWTFDTPQTCTITSNQPQVDTLQVPATVTENETAANLTESMPWAYDTRFSSSPMGRIQRLTFIDGSLLSGSQNLFQWQYGYPGTPLDPDQPNLVTQAELTNFSSYLQCGYNTPLPGYNVYAYVRFGYERLASYILDNYK